MKPNLLVFIVERITKIKNGAYVINLGEYKSLGTLWIALCVNGNNVTYLDGCGVEHISKEIKKCTGKKIIKLLYYFILSNRRLKALLIYFHQTVFKNII